MANFSLEQLLKYTPFEALLIAYNEQHGTTLNPRYVALDSVLSSNGRNATVRLKARADLPNQEEKKFTNQGDIIIERLNIGELFNEPFYLRYAGRIVARDVATAITKVTGVVFDENDFIEDIITVSNNKLKASPNSLRWYGEMTIYHEDRMSLVGLLDPILPELELEF